MNARSADGNTALAYAGTSTEPESLIVTYLIRGGADVDALNNDGQTPLMIMAMSESSYAYYPLATLLESHASVNSQCNDGKTALMYACAASESREGVETLLAAGADLDAADDRGRTSLMLAAESGKVGIAKVLVEAGADMDRVDNAGENALAIAKRCGHSEVFDM